MRKFTRFINDTRFPFFGARYGGVWPRRIFPVGARAIKICIVLSIDMNSGLGSGLVSVSIFNQTRRTATAVESGNDASQRSTRIGDRSLCSRFSGCGALSHSEDDGCVIVTQ